MLEVISKMKNNNKIDLTAIYEINIINQINQIVEYKYHGFVRMY